MDIPDTKSPLLRPKSFEDQPHDGYDAATFSSAVFSLSTTIVGAGIMGLPAAMSVVGLIPGLLLIVFVGFLTYASISFLLKYTDAARATTYAGVMADTFGRTGRIVLQICVVINNFGLLVVYLIIIADVLSGSTSSSVHHSGVLEEWGGGQTWWNGRTIVMFATTLFILIPLVSVRHIDKLSLSSAISVALAVLFVLVTAAVAIWRIIYGTISFPKLFPDFTDDEYSVFSYFSVVPIVVTAYICHHCVHPIVNELEKGISRRAIICTSLVLCGGIYLATSFFGYLLFGDDTLSDILSNFDVDLGVPYSAVFSGIVRVGYAVHLMLVFPLLHFSLRLNVDGLLFPAAIPISRDTRRFTLLTAFLVGFALLAACFVPSIWDAFQITGSTSGVMVGYILPGLLVLRDIHNIATRGEKWLAGSMVVLAIISSVIALSGDIYDYFV